MIARAVASVACLLTVAGSAAASPSQKRADRLIDEVRQRAGKPEAIAPLGALLRLEDELPPGELVPLLGEVAEGKAHHPLVAAQAAYHLAVEEERRGKADRAEARRQALGFWRHFRVLGPFDAQGRSGLGREYPPEQGERRPDPRSQQVFAGKERDVAWRVVPPEAFREGAVFLDALLRPESDAVAYLMTVVRTPAARQVVARLGTPGPVKLWVNGAPVFQKIAVHPAVPDQDAVPVSLRAGDNWILVKTVITGGAWRLFLRFTDAAGRPVAGLAPGEPVGPVPTLAPAGGQKGKTGTAPDLTALLRRRAEGARTPAAWLDLARALALLQSEDVESKPVEGALGRAGNGSEALLLLSEVAREEDDRRAALEVVAGRKAEPALRALALTRLGELHRQHRRDAAATASWRQALAADPGCWQAALALAFDEQNIGLASAALARLDGLPAEVRRVPRVARARARVLESLGRRADAQQVLTAIHEVRRTDLDVAQELAAHARARGDLARAAALYREAAVRRPDLTFMTFETARLLEGQGDLAGARALLAEVAARLPDDARIPEEQGRLLARANLVKEAIPFLTRALTLRPQNPGLRRYAERLAAEVGQGSDRAAAAEDLARRFAADAEALGRAAFAAPPSGRAATPAAGEAKDVEGTVVLLDRKVVRVHRNGLSELFAQRVVQVRSERAARENQEFYVRYTPGSQEVEIRRARILRRAGAGELEISEATGRDDRDLSEPWYGLYYDNRAEVVSYEDLRAGDVIEVQYTVADVGLRNELADYFGDFEFIGETASKKQWDYTLIAPTERTFHFNEPRVAGLKKTVDKYGAEVVHRWSATDVPRVQPEPSMPGFAEAAPYLHVSTYPGWPELARWYWHLVEDQLAADDALRRAAVETTRGLRTDEEKVRALHRYVIEGTRYVGLEFGIHGFKPYKVTQVLSRRFGDCKDKASLLLVLLREVGIESELVLLRTRRGGKIEPAPASLAVFDHAIVYVPKLSLYLDGTAEFSGMRELPSQDQGVMVLRVSPRAATLTETPVLPASANRASRVWKVDLAADGGGRIAEDLTLTGQAAPEWRVHYQTPGERQERLSKVWTARFPGAKLDGFSFVGIEDRNHPVTVHAEVTVPRLAERRAGGELQLPITSRETDFVRTYARLSRRRHDLQLGYPWLHEEELIVRLPDGWKVVRQPGGRREKTPFGRFELEVSPADGGRALRIRSVVEVERIRIGPDEYGAFRKFLGVIDGALGERIIVAREEG